MTSRRHSRRPYFKYEPDSGDNYPHGIACIARPGIGGTVSEYPDHTQADLEEVVEILNALRTPDVYVGYVDANGARHTFGLPSRLHGENEITTLGSVEIGRLERKLLDATERRVFSDAVDAFTWRDSTPEAEALDAELDESLRQMGLGS